LNGKVWDLVLDQFECGVGVDPGRMRRDGREDLAVEPELQPGVRIVPRGLDQRAVGAQLRRADDAQQRWHLPVPAGFAAKATAPAAAKATCQESCRAAL
jgi:hypothetical protein